MSYYLIMQNFILVMGFLLLSTEAMAYSFEFVTAGILGGLFSMILLPYFLFKLVGKIQSKKQWKMHSFFHIVFTLILSLICSIGIGILTSLFYIAIFEN